MWTSYMTGGLTRSYRDMQEKHHVKAEADIGLLYFHSKDPRPQNCERTTLCYFKFPSWWYVVTAAPGN